MMKTTVLALFLTAIVCYGSAPVAGHIADLPGFEGCRITPSSMPGGIAILTIECENRKPCVVAIGPNGRYDTSQCN